MTTTTDLDFLGILNNFEHPQVTKLNELEQKLEKVATSIKTLEVTHSRIELTFDRVEEKLDKIPTNFNSIHQYIIAVNKQVSELFKSQKQRYDYDNKFFIGVISFLLTVLMTILFSLGQTGFPSQLY